MRSTRALVTGAVLGAALTLGAPAAYAEDADPAGSNNGYATTQDSQDPSATGAQQERSAIAPRENSVPQENAVPQENSAGRQDSAPATNHHDPGRNAWHDHGKDGAGGHQWQGKGKEGHEGGGHHEGGNWGGHHRPHGGVHTGGGGMAVDSGGGMAAGAVLLVGGLGAGAYALRRRSAASKAV